ncbi:dihydroxyacetone kinase subunit DhaL [Defluviitalea phaphyphila]|uniref:dihydroxyacetone kinase subunit DhaL n=1 Tax=Defluviitalea phaphyphila TaxID=1473580 RepID=UPI00072FF235|nr:dihydroxyacetone kinase subunit DhaL [Defluviitalea phaphyphila]
MIKINKKKRSIPKYKIIAEDIEKQIKQGILKRGEPMNSELKTQQQYNVSRVTVRKAYKVLLDKGIIRTVPGVGTFVNDLYNNDWTWMNSFTTQVMKEGHVPTTKVKKFQVIKANAQLAKRIGIKEKEECFFLERVRFIDNQPMWITRSYIPKHLAPSFTKEYLSVAGMGQSIFKVLEMNFDIKCVKRLKIYEEIIENPEDAKVLNVEPEKKLMLKKSIAYDNSNNPVVYEETTMAQANVKNKRRKKGIDMKVAVHMSMFCKNWTDDILPHIKKVEEIGFDGVEISLFGSTEEKIQKALKLANDLGLDVICGTGVTEDTDPSSEDENIRKNATDYLKKCVDLVADGGGLYLNGVLYAPWQKFSDTPREIRWKNASKVLKEVGMYAKEKNIGLNIEVINRFETDFFNRIEEAVEFLKMINLDNVKLLVDTFHMNIEEDDIYKALEKNISYIGCIHICENHRGVPGTGHIDWKKIIDILKKNNYRGYLDMESFVESGTEVGNSLFIWNGKNRDPYEEAEKGLKHIRSIIGVKNKYKELAANLNALFKENAEYLCKLDSEAGDGDHGTTISRGFQRAYEKVQELDDSATGSEVLKTIGYAMLESMGGASGPIFSLLFIQMSTLLKEKEELDVEVYKKSIENTINAITDLTGTKRGEKTMLDALYGAKDACDVFEGDNLLDVMECAKEGAHKGSLATMEMKATRGRAKFLQEKSVGYLDAGSHSIYLILSAFLETWK